MDEISLEKLERIARNAIHQHLRLEKVEGELGIIYFAHGLNADGEIVGVWGYNDQARVLEFKKDTKLDTVRQALITDAAGFLEMQQGI